MFLRRPTSRVQFCIGIALVLLIVSGLVQSSATPEATEEGMTDKHGLIRGDITEVLDADVPLCGVGTAGLRFVVSADNTEVCDNTTGLYWEQSPSVTNSDWPSAVEHCASLDLGNGQEYRLPEVEELSTLVDYSVGNQADDLNMQNGPFSGVVPGYYWSHTESANLPMWAWNVYFGAGAGSGQVAPTGKATLRAAWCVR